MRDETKFGRMVAFSEVLPKIRARVDADLARPGLPREKVLATVVRLLECTNIRVGNDEYARANGSYGLTTLRDKHVEVSGGSLRFSFKGKSGKTHEVELSDRRVARIVQRCRDVPGEELFQYLDDDGTRQTIGSGDVNDYLREISGQEFTAKDFRTWAGTMLAVRALRELGPVTTVREAKSAIIKAVDQVADQLNNTRAVCRKYYIHPSVLETYLAGTMLSRLGNGTRLAAAAERLGAKRPRRRRWSGCSAARTRQPSRNNSIGRDRPVPCLDQAEDPERHQSQRHEAEQPARGILPAQRAQHLSDSAGSGRVVGPGRLEHQRPAHPHHQGARGKSEAADPDRPVAVVAQGVEPPVAPDVAQEPPVQLDHREDQQGYSDETNQLHAEWNAETLGHQPLVGVVHRRGAAQHTRKTECQATPFDG